MTYDAPIYDAKVFPLFDFGGGATEAYSFRGPAGKVGRIKRIGVAVTEVFATETTQGRFDVGVSGTPLAYASLVIPDLSADLDFIDASDDTDAIVAEIPADTLVEINLTNGTGAAATGQGIPMLDIEWS